MFESAISEPMLLLMRKLSTFQEISQTFYLVGGTALALHYGHRKSEDLDFFTSLPFEVDKLSPFFISLGGTVISEGKGTLHLVIDDIKVSFLHYPYSLLKPCQIWNGLPIASIEDIACMKTVAISQRGEKKDFYDMYEILQHFTPHQLKEIFLAKYTEHRINCYYILKSFFYFNDAENVPDPVMLNGMTWQQIKTFFLRQEATLMTELCIKR